MFLFETPESPRLFKRDWMDMFTRTHWSSVPLLFVPITLYCVYASVRAGVSYLPTAALFVTGFVLWTLAEYWLHRKVFHWLPAGKYGEAFHFWVHGVHHTWPSDPYRLVMPPAVNLTLLFLVAGPGFVYGFGAFGWALLGGFVCGYMNYDVTHYFLHHSKPKSKWFKALKAHHMNHHFNKDGRKYGVSFQIWDHVFKTL